ncbi:MAG TPA: hypothetical protein VKX16_07395 [Chloroflexota bacterium]|nr:hypothetical protein [Chloroflexota bacterium]
MKFLTPLTLLLSFFSASAVALPRQVALASATHSASKGHAQARGRRTVRHRDLHGYFPVFSLAGTATRGVVSAVQHAGNTSLTVSVSGLAPYSIHAVHVHLGSCRAPYAGAHIYVLGFLRANSRGYASVTGPGLSPYYPATTYVIIYNSAVPALIVGCATLGRLM